jgi:hypothetical protein
MGFSRIEQVPFGLVIEVPQGLVFSMSSLMQLDLLDNGWMDMHCTIIILYHTDTVHMKCPSTSKVNTLCLQ